MADQVERKQRLIQKFKTMPIAINTLDANEQHYEVNKTKAEGKRFDLLLFPLGTNTVL